MKKLICTALALGFTWLPAQAEIIKLAEEGTVQARQSEQSPQNGMTRELVKANFGAPQATSDPVGEPPISSWEYEDYVVYYEYDLVLHTVMKPAPEAE